MDNNLPAWLVRALAIWTSLGAIFTLIGTNIIGLPAWVPALFSTETADVIIAFAGSVVIIYQYFRMKFFSKPEAQIKVLSAGDKRGYLINPFKIAA